MLAGLCLAASARAEAAPDPAAGQRSVVVTLIPEAVSPDQLMVGPKTSIGMMSSKLGSSAPAQTYLDISQGSRLPPALYDRQLPVLSNRPGDLWPQVLARAESAPGEIKPGLLGRALKENGIAVQITPEVGLGELIAADEDPHADLRADCAIRRCPGLTVTRTSVVGFKAIVGRMETGDLVIALEPAPPTIRGQLAMAVAGTGFGAGTLTSSTTRADGLVSAVDLAPTILSRFGLRVPGAMNGQEITAQAGRDADALEDFEDRMSVIVPRRSPVILFNLMLWVIAAAVVSLLSRGRMAPRALSILALAFMWLPAVLLLCGAIWPSELAERLIVGLGCPILGAVTLALLRRYAAVAVACSVSVLAHMGAVLSGSLVLSLAGSNPGSGSRFYGIGNELEATLAAQLVLAVGAGLIAWRQARCEQVSDGPDSAGAMAFGAAGLAGAAVFAPGAFGADVGAAIVMPAAAAAAAAVALRLGWRLALALIAGAALVLLAALFAIDAISGGDSHLSRSVLGAGDSDALLEVVERRLRLTRNSFDLYSDSPVLWVTVGLAVAGLVYRNRVLAWIGDRRPALAAAVGVAAVAVVGTASNDSGPLLWIIGILSLAAFIAVAWAESAEGAPAAEKRRSTHGLSPPAGADKPVS